MRRENHFVAIGNTPLAVNTRRELAKRGRPVTRIFYEAPVEGQIKDVDVVVVSRNPFLQRYKVSRARPGRWQRREGSRWPYPSI